MSISILDREFSVLKKMVEPVCPECGYNIRKLINNRCPECGVIFPTKHSKFRRWAIQRLWWDRVNRSNALTDYMKTIIVILFCPWRAGRQLVIPDRWYRSAYWACMHLVLSAFAAALLGNNYYFLRWLFHKIHSSLFSMPYMFMLIEAPAIRVLIWFVQSVVVWLFAFIIPIAIASSLTVLMPGRHRSAKLAGLKWSIYLAPIYLIIVIAWYACHYSYSYLTTNSTIQDVAAMTPLPVALVTSIYGIWWVAGIASHPYNRNRYVRTYCIFISLFIGMLVIFRKLFPFYMYELF